MSYEQWPYLTVFLVLLASGLGLPLPEDIPLLTAGYLCHAEQAVLPAMIATSMVGVVGSDLFLFLMGRRFGHRIVEHRLIRRLVNPPRLLTAERLFARHGVKIIFVGRFLPGLRPMIFMAAGVLRVRRLVFLAVDGLAAAISVPTLIILGKLFGGSIEKIQQGIRVASHSILVAAVIGGLLAGAVWLHRRQKRLLVDASVPGDIQAEDLARIPPAAACPHRAGKVTTSERTGQNVEPASEGLG